MFFSIVFTLLLGIATALQFAVEMAPDIKESHDNAAARRVLIAGLLTLFMWMVYRCFAGDAANPLLLFGLTMIVLAEIGFCFNRLFPGSLGSAIQRTALMRKKRRTETYQ